MEPISLKELKKNRQELIELQELIQSLKPVIEELKRDEKVKRYIDAYSKYKASEEKVKKLKENLKYEEMIYCDHYFVVNEQRSDFDGHRTDKTTIKTCIHCGLTNRYIHLYMDPAFPEYNDMNELFINTGAYNYPSHGFYEYDEMDDVKKLYKKFKDDNPKATDKQIEKHLTLIKELKEKK